MPKDLSPESEQEWRRIVKELIRRGTMTRVDASSLEVYVRMWARWKQCLADIEKNGPVVTTEWTDSEGEVHQKRIENPASKIAGRLENSIRAYQKEFSATPASREKTKPTAQRTPKNPPPVPGSIEFFEAQAAAMREHAQELEQTPEPEPTPEEPVDINSIDLEKV